MEISFNYNFINISA